MGPLVTKAHRDKVASYIDAGEADGAKIVVDGRNVSANGGAEGFWLGPTLIDHVTPEMSVYTDEIFGPVLSVIRVETYDEALDLINSNPYGNGTAIFTNDGGAARRFQNEVEVGMIGINVPIPVPMAYFSFGGWKNSLFGDTHAHGMEGVHFFTRGKAITSRWLDPSHGGIELGLPAEPSSHSYRERAVVVRDTPGTAYNDCTLGARRRRMTDPDSSPPRGPARATPRRCTSRHQSGAHRRTPGRSRRRRLLRTRADRRRPHRDPRHHRVRRAAWPDRRAGLTHVEIELLERWWIPRGEPGHTYDVRDLLFEAADVLPPVQIKIGSENGPPTPDPLALAAPLRELAEQAAAHGTRVAIETMPFSAIATVPMGAEIVSAADHPAAGLLVDAWHVFRAGTTLDELRAVLTPEMIFGVELDDAAPDSRRDIVRGHRRTTGCSAAKALST